MFDKDWKLFEFIKAKGHKIFVKNPFLLIINDVSISESAFFKEILWSYKASSNLKNDDILLWFKYWIKIVLLLTKSKNFKISLNNKVSSNKKLIGIYIDDVSLFNLVEDLVHILHLNDFIVIGFQFQKHNYDVAKLLNAQHIDYFSSTLTPVYINLNLVQRLKIIFSSIFSNTPLCYYLLNARLKVVSDFYNCSQLFNSYNPTCVLLNVAEQNSLGVVCTQLAHLRECKTINFQNGWKGNDPLNIDVDFDAWFVHDYFMKQVLVDSGVSNNQLKVVGHFLEDKIKKYKYQGSLDSIVNDKMVITVFTSFLYEKEHSELLKELIKFKNQNNQFVILVRPHPSDKKNYLAFKEAGFYILENSVLGNNELFSNSLFDVFSISSYSISFGSMVSCQSKWFGVPAYTIEFQGVSILNYVDELSVKHVKNLNDIISMLKEIKEKKGIKKRSYSQNLNSVSDRMLQEIKKIIN